MGKNNGKNHWKIGKTWEKPLENRKNMGKTTGK